MQQSKQCGSIVDMVQTSGWCVSRHADNSQAVTKGYVVLPVQA